MMPELAVVVMKAKLMEFCCCFCFCLCWYWRWVRLIVMVMVVNTWSLQHISCWAYSASSALDPLDSRPKAAQPRSSTTSIPYSYCLRALQRRALQASSLQIYRRLTTIGPSFSSGALFCLFSVWGCRRKPAQPATTALCKYLQAAGRQGRTGISLLILSPNARRGADDLAGQRVWEAWKAWHHSLLHLAELCRCACSDKAWSSSALLFADLSIRAICRFGGVRQVDYMTAADARAMLAGPNHQTVAFTSRISPAMQGSCQACLPESRPNMSSLDTVHCSFALSVDPL